jgi:hypothetical protein
MKRTLFVSFALLGSTWLASCGSGNTVPEQPPSPVDDFATRYAQATCKAMEDCCKTGSFTYDEAYCEYATGGTMSQSIYGAQATLKVHFDQAAAEKCLTMRVALYKSCMGDGAAELAACNAILAGEVPVGSSCTSPFECAPADGMRVTCTPDAPNTTKGHCTVVPPPPDPLPVGKSGDACSATCLTSPTDGCKIVDGAPSATACLVSDGFICDGTTHVCAPVPQIGDACSPFCVTGAYCGVDGHCQAKTADGSCAAGDEACTDTSICACADNSCVPAQKFCVARGGTGAQCANDNQCLSGFCYHGFCRVKTPVSQALCDGEL